MDSAMVGTCRRGRPGIAHEPAVPVRTPHGTAVPHGHRNRARAGDEDRAARGHRARCVDCLGVVHDERLGGQAQGRCDRTEVLPDVQLHARAGQANHHAADRLASGVSEDCSEGLVDRPGP